MSASIEALAVSVKGGITRRTAGGRTTLVLTEEQANEFYAALGPVIEFFKNQHAAEQE